MLHLKNKTIIVTGSAGFVGFHVSLLLLKHGCTVIGIDNFSDYYEISLKENRHNLLKCKNFIEIRGDLKEANILENILNEYSPSVFIHLAAQAGVRESVNNPRRYFDNNLLVTFNILENLKTFKIQHFLMSSTSSVYGFSEEVPYKENQKADHQVSFYAATKKSCELMAHSYSHLHQIPITIFRFFTVYGPWGRPDMAYYKFTKNILENKTIEIYNDGKMIRDFTYIDDLSKAIQLLLEIIPPLKKNRSKFKIIENDSLSLQAPFRIVNVGNSKKVNLMEFINILEKKIGKKAKKKYKPFQQGDVPTTLASSDLLKQLTGFKPNTDIDFGLEKFVNWFRSYHKI